MFVPSGDIATEPDLRTPAILAGGDPSRPAVVTSDAGSVHPGPGRKPGVAEATLDTIPGCVPAGGKDCPVSRSALLFTMDTLPGYVSAARRGGPSGEILVREGLQTALCELGWHVHTASSDAEAWGITERCFAPGEGAPPSQADRVRDAGGGPAGNGRRGGLGGPAAPETPCPSVVIVDEFTAVDSSPGVRAALRRHARAGRVFIMSFFGRALPPLLQADVGAANVLTTYATPMSGIGKDLGFSALGFALDRTGGTEAEEDEAAEEAERLSAALGSCRLSGHVASEWGGKAAARYASLAAAEHRAAREAHGTGEMPLRPDPVPELLKQQQGQGVRCAAYGLLWGKEDQYVAPQMQSIRALLDAFGDGAAVDPAWGGGVRELVAKRDESGAVLQWDAEPTLVPPVANDAQAGAAALEGRLCLLSTARGKGGSDSSIPATPGLITVGRVNPHTWHSLLEGACFLIGMGRPLAGPSALEAMARGALFVNPEFPPISRRRSAGKPPFETSRDLRGFSSQNPGAAALGPEPHDPGLPRACNVSMTDDGRLDAPSLIACVRRSLLHARCQVDATAPLVAEGGLDTGPSQRFSGHGPNPWFSREALRDRTRKLLPPH